MPDPVLHVIAGPNGAGKSTFYDEVIGPATHLRFVNADVIAQGLRPEDSEAMSYEAAQVATAQRAGLINDHVSFATETVFSHESKLELLHVAIDAGYLVTLHVVVIPAELAVARVASRVAVGGHAVPEDKIRARYQRLWPIVATAIGFVERAIVYDNSRAATPFRAVANFEHGTLVGEPAWPTWSPQDLRDAGGKG